MILTVVALSIATSPALLSAALAVGVAEIVVVVVVLPLASVRVVVVFSQPASRATVRTLAVRR